MAEDMGYFDDIETEVSKPKKSRASPRPRSAASKKANKGSPYTTGAVRSKSARESWLSAVKSGTALGPRGKSPTHPKTPTEYWTDTLRRTGVGYTSTGHLDSFSGLKKAQTRNMAYGSTSHFLRQMAGTEKAFQAADPAPSKAAPGKPAYKTPEEYYDEVLALKKQIHAINSDNSTLKSKVRRIEEDNIKKEREIEHLLDPSKSDEMRRTLADKRPDTGTVIHSLKQKILKLEHQLKDKEAEYNKLHSDLKTTKVEELKMQMETFYKEIVRLNQIKSLPTNSVARKTAPLVQESPGKLKALRETILRMNEQSTRLMAENKTLKQDLSKFMEDAQNNRDRKKEYDDMTKKELMSALGKLEKRLDRTEADNLSIASDVDGRRKATEGKVTLEGSVAQRLDQLDRRETELLEEAAKQRAVMKRLKDDRAHYRGKADEKDKEIKRLKKEIEDLQAELDGFYDNDKARVTPRSARGSSSAKARSRSPGIPSGRIQKVEEFTQNHAAKTIQKSWRSHRADKMDEDEATTLIQGTIKGHQSRRKNMERMRGYFAEEDGGDSGLSDATDPRSGRRRPASDLSRGKRSSASRSPRPSSRRSPSRALNSTEEDSEETEEDRPRKGRRASGSLSGRSTPRTTGRATPTFGRTTPTFGRSNTPTGRATTPTGRATLPSYTSPKGRPTSARRTKTPPAADSEDDDDDDDFIITGGRGGRGSVKIF